MPAILTQPTSLNETDFIDVGPLLLMYPRSRILFRLVEQSGINQNKSFLLLPLFVSLFLWLKFSLAFLPSPLE